MSQNALVLFMCALLAGLLGRVCCYCCACLWFENCFCVVVVVVVVVIVVVLVCGCLYY